MKKLLTILGSISMIASAGSLVVACKSKSDINDDTGSEFVRSVIGPNGEIKIDAAGLLRWYQKNIGFNGVKQVKEFNQLFAVGLMVEASNDNSIIFYGERPLWKEPTLQSNQYGLENFPQELKKLWGSKADKGLSVQGAAASAFEKMEKSYEGKDSRTSLVNSLKKQFPYVEAKYESLKTAWINSYILTDSENGALAQLTKLLWNRSSNDLKNEVPDQASLLRTFYNLWRGSTVSSLEGDINEEIKNNWDGNQGQERKINLLNLINATGGTNPNITTQNPIQPWRVDQIQWANQDTSITPELVKDLLNRLYNPTPNAGADITKQYEGSKTVTQHWSYVNKNGNPLSENDTYFALVETYPEADFNQAKFELSSETVFGFLTNSQRFGVDQFLVNQRPVSISEIVFKKSDVGDLAQNINGEAFLSPKTVDDSAWTQFYGLFNFLQNYVTGSNPGVKDNIPGISQYNFDTIFGNLLSTTTNVIRLTWPSSTINRDDKWSSNFYDVKNHDKLLTLSNSSYSNILKYSVYDFIQANQSKTLPTYSLDPNSKSGSSNIRDSLINDYGFVSTNTADIIASSINKINEEGLKTAATQGLYATLNLIEQLNRKVKDGNEDKSSSDKQSENKIYQVLNSEQGIIAFVDTDGLHITKINGYDVLNNNQGNHPLGNQTSNVFGQSTEERNTYVNETHAFKRLQDYEKNDTNVGSYRYVYQDYNNQIFDADRKPIDDPFIQKIVNTYEIQTLPRLGVSYTSLNPEITNDYERFLVNNSILSSRSPSLTPFYRFNIFDEVKEYLTSNDDKDNLLSPNNSWIMDYVGVVLGFKPQDKTSFIHNILDYFMKFENTVDSQEFKKWLVEVLETNINHTKNFPQLNFRTGWDNWNQEINNSRVTDVEQNEDLPLMILDWGDNQSHINNLVASSLFQPFAQASFFEYHLSSQWNLVRIDFLPSDASHKRRKGLK